MAIDPVEKKPFAWFLQNSKTFTLALAGKCSLNCLFCENYKISQNEEIKGKYFSPSDVVSDAIEKHCKSVSMSYNEPTVSYEYLIDLANECRKNNLKFMLKTNAYINKDPWQAICLGVSAINIDWKGSEEKFKSVTGAGSYVLQDRIKEIYNSGTYFEISIPLYYQDDELEDEIKIVGEFLSSIDKNIPCHLLRISPSYQYDSFIFNPDNLEKAKEILSKYMNNIYTVV